MQVHSPPLNHIGLWVDNIHEAVKYLSDSGVRFTPGGVRKGVRFHTFEKNPQPALPYYAFCGRVRLIIYIVCVCVCAAFPLPRRSFQAAGHEVCFIHPKGSEDLPVGGCGVLIELVQVCYFGVYISSTIAHRIKLHCWCKKTVHYPLRRLYCLPHYPVTIGTTPVVSSLFFVHSCSLSPVPLHIFCV